MFNYMLHARRPLVDGVDYIEPTEGKNQLRKRTGLPKYQSKLSERRGAVLGGAGQNHGVRGSVRYNNGVLEYFNTDEHVWIPAVYHCRIRDRLLAKSKTCDADVYTHPRARGWGALDTTAFLQSQKDWNLERDYGWNGVEVLFKFNNDMLNPTYEVPWLYEDGCVVLNLDHRPLRAFENIPLTLSSEVEGVLMEAIIRYDVRISIEDFWARIPGMCGHGGIFTPNALTVRRNKFRLKNCVAAWGPKRRGSKNIRKYIEDHMSPADVAANTTGGLHKLSQAEQKEARKPNAGKHNQNAGGWGLPKRGRNDAEEEGPAPKRSRGNRIRKGTSIRSKPRAPTPSAVYAPQTSADAVLDPLLDPRLIDLDGYGPSVLPTDGHRPLPIGAGNGPLGQYVNQYTLPSVDTEMSYQNMFPVPNWPVESPCTQCGSGFDIGNPFGLQGISTNYQQVPSAFIGSMPTPHMECMPSEQQVNPYSDLVYDW